MPSTGSLAWTEAVRAGTKSNGAIPPQNNVASVWQPLPGSSEVWDSQP